MTREEVYTEIFNSTKISRDSKKYVDMLTKKIYDDFESRICKNCKHCRRNGYVLTCNLRIISDYLFDNKEDLDRGMINKNFGCNRFEKKLEVKND